MVLPRKWPTVGPGEWRLLLRAALVVSGFRIGLWILPLRRLTALAPRSSRSVPRYTPDRVGWTVRATARRIPRATCLTRALATRWLLAAEGVPSSLHFGARKADDGGLRAHAWLECDGRVIVGGDEDLDAYERFEARPGVAPQAGESARPGVPR